jgi:hypothetical protein
MRSPETMMSVSSSMWSRGSKGPSTGLNRSESWAKGERRGGAVGEGTAEFGRWLELVALTSTFSVQLPGIEPDALNWAFSF